METDRKVDDYEKQLSLKNAEIQDARNDLESMQTSLDFYLHYTEELLGLVYGLQKTIDTIHESSRWKITQPLWKIKHFFADPKETETSENQNCPKCVPSVTFTDYTDDPGRNILFIDRTVPQPDRDAGSRSIMQYMKLLVALGYTVKLFADEVNPDKKYLDSLEKCGIGVLYRSTGWKEYLAENKSRIVCVFINRPNVAVKYIDMMRKNTRAKIIYMGCDLHFLRGIREYEETGDKDALESAEKIKLKEFIAMSKADTVLMYSEYEKDIIKEEFDIDYVVVAPIYYFEDFKSIRKAAGDTKDILFVGGFMHKPNVDGIIWFFSEIWNRVKESIPDARLIVVGSNPPKEVQELAGERVDIRGYISEQELQNLYATCRVCVIPLRFGAGIKGKTIEALLNEIPVISTSVGLEGIPEIHNHIQPADNEADFADQLAQKYLNEDKSLLTSRAVSACIRKYYSRENLEQILLSIIH